MDGAHNPHGARSLAAHARATGVRPHLFFSAMGDKDLAGMQAELETMEPASVTLVRGENPRYATAEALRALWGAHLEVLDIAAAARRLREPSAGPIRLVCGSLYFIGDLLRALGTWNPPSEPVHGRPPLARGPSLFATVLQSGLLCVREPIEHPWAGLQGGSRETLSASNMRPGNPRFPKFIFFFRARC